MKTIPIQWLNLLVHCFSDLSKHKVDVEFSKEKEITLNSDRDGCEGYFLAGNPDYPETIFLKVATGGWDAIDWLFFFSHEYNHFCQWKESHEFGCKWVKQLKKMKDGNTPPFPAGLKDYGINQSDWDLVIFNRPIKEDKLLQIVKDARDCELDCEKRTVKMLKKFKISKKTIEDYVKYANVQVFFYTYVIKLRKDTTTPPFCSGPPLESKVKGSFYKNYDVIPKTLLKEFETRWPITEPSNLIVITRTDLNQHVRDCHRRMRLTKIKC